MLGLKLLTWNFHTPNNPPACFTLFFFLIIQSLHKPTSLLAIPIQYKQESLTFQCIVAISEENVLYLYFKVSQILICVCCFPVKCGCISTGPPDLGIVCTSQVLLMDCLLLLWSWWLLWHPRCLHYCLYHALCSYHFCFGFIVTDLC